MKGYYFITDSSLSRAGIFSDVEKAVRAGVELIQYREKNADTRQLYEEARRIQELCTGTRSRLIVNDRVDIALAIGADGVHIGNEDMPYEVARRLLGPGRIIGVTVHYLEEAVEAEAMGADYLGISPVFATATKGDAGAPCGAGLIRQIRRRCRVPLAAIGGISLENVDEVIRAGADMVCAISAVVTSEDAAGEIVKFQRRFEKT